MDKEIERDSHIQEQPLPNASEMQLNDRDNRLQLKKEQMKQKLKLTKTEESLFQPLVSNSNEIEQERLNNNKEKGNTVNEEEAKKKRKRKKLKKGNEGDSNEQPEIVQDNSNCTNQWDIQIKPQVINSKNGQQSTKIQSKEASSVKNRQEQQVTKKSNEKSSSDNFQVSDKSNKSNKNQVISGQSNSHQQTEINASQLQHKQEDNIPKNKTTPDPNTRNFSKGKQNESDRTEENKDIKSGKGNKPGVIIVQTEKQKQKKQGYYSKINYNLSEIIQKQIIPIKVEEKQKVQAKENTTTSNQPKETNQSEQFIESIAQHVLGKKPKKSKNNAKGEQKNNSQQENGDQSKASANSKKDKGMTEKQTKNINQAKSQNQKLINEREQDELDLSIKKAKEELNNILKQQQASSGWDAVILTEKELRDIEGKIKLQKQKISDLQLKKDIIVLEEKNKKQRLIQEQNERKKQRYLRKLKRLGHLKNISKEIALFKISRGLPNPKQNRVIKYKAVPQGQLDFELIEKRKKKVSKIKTALKTYAELQTNGKANKKKLNEQDDDFFETVNEESENENGDKENQTNENKALQKKMKEKNTFLDDEIMGKRGGEVEELVLQHDGIYKLPSHIDETNNLEGFKYNNMFLRSWVDHMPLKEIDDLVLQFVNELAYKQAMKKLNDPKKSKKRIVAGFKEVLSTLTTNVKEKKSKCIIIALNLQQNPLEHGSDQLVLEIINLALQKRIPIIHSSSRARLGKAFTGKFGPRIGVLSVVNFEGLSDSINTLEDLVNQQRQNYILKYSTNSQAQNSIQE